MESRTTVDGRGVIGVYSKLCNSSRSVFHETCSLHQSLAVHLKDCWVLQPKCATVLVFRIHIASLSTRNAVQRANSAQPCMAELACLYWAAGVTNGMLKEVAPWRSLDAHLLLQAAAVKSIYTPLQANVLHQEDGCIASIQNHQSTGLYISWNTTTQRMLGLGDKNSPHAGWLDKPLIIWCRRSRWRRYTV